LVGIDEGTTNIPTTFSLDQNYPNPFNPTTKIRFGLPTTQTVVIKIYDLLGREVSTIVNETLPPAFHAVDFDGSALSAAFIFIA